MTVLDTIRQHQLRRSPLMVVLVDPDKGAYPSLLPYLSQVDMLFVGGSSGNEVDTCVAALRAHTSAPIVLFPGSVEQFSDSADALLFLTLLNSRLSEVLIEPHVKAAATILLSGIEVIPMGYILLDGECQSAVQRVSRCQPLSQRDPSAVIDHALAGQLLGKQLIYLEAGSGAKTPVSIDIIRAVKDAIDLPLIVGGGIVSHQQMCQAFKAGADVVVIGNHFEQNPQDLPLFIEMRQRYAQSR